MNDLMIVTNVMLVIVLAFMAKNLIVEILEYDYEQKHIKNP